MAPTVPQKRSNKKRDWDDFVQFGHLLARHKWVYAKTMPENPHEYTVRKNWVDDEFVWTVNYLRSYGYAEYYRKARYIQINVNEHFYWTMGAPVPITILINRKKVATDVAPLGFVTNATAYDVMADPYDGLWRTQDVIDENRAVFDLVGSLVGKTVLDVGCGNGLTLDTVRDQLDVGRYVGLDPSSRMLHQFRRRYPGFGTIQTSLYDFVPPLESSSTYDVVLALFGAGSHLTAEELRRIPELLRPGGRAAVMFYLDGHQPKLDDTAGARGLITPWHGQFPGNPHVIGNHLLVIYEN